MTHEGVKERGVPAGDDERGASAAAQENGRESDAPATARKSQTATPMMTQYLRLKEEAGEAILFFRMGDFYEMFFEDAVAASEILALTLTSRNKSDPDPIPMAGVPWHSAEPHIARLLQAGRRVAICEQVEAGAGGLMERRIVEILTPGTTLAEGLLEEGRSNYLCALAPSSGQWGLAAADISTGEFLIGQDVPELLEEDLDRLAPREILVPPSAREEPWVARFCARHPEISRATLDDWDFTARRGHQLLGEHFGVATLEPYGMEDLSAGLGAAGALLAYAREQKRSPLAHLRPPRRLSPARELVLDEATLRNLEVLEPLSGRGRHCLLGVLDDTRTALGARAVRAALSRPSLDPGAIQTRHAGVAALIASPAALESLRAGLARCADLERLLGRMHCRRGTPRDLARLRDTLAAVSALLDLAAELRGSGEFPVGEGCDPCADLRAELTRAVEENPSLATDGDAVRGGYDPELDELRAVTRQGRDWIARLQEREREASAIPSLKVGYNKVFGYYIEVTRAHLARVPERYQRKQTLVNAERFVTPELKEWEERILTAQERAAARQSELVARLEERVRGATARLQALAAAIAEWDLLASFANVARRRGYVRPGIDEGDRIVIRDGRHPVVERFLAGDAFVPNDLEVDTRGQQILVITGPNMAGKSTFLRQVGLLVLMAQAGSFVPAAEARIGIVDRIFTRVGASDSIARGQSTFLVEMIETSRILHAATSRSLVLLDEIGRGTSTFDGLAIAWAVAERLRESARQRPRTLFATHFHELTVLARRHSGYVNLNVLVKEWKDRVIFVRRVVPGAADRSYGIQVARLAGLPESVLRRAREILTVLETGGGGRGASLLAGVPARDPQILLFAGDGSEEGSGAAAGLAPAPSRESGAEGEAVRGAAPDAAEAERLRSELARLHALLAEADPDRMTPRAALAWLYDLKRRFGSAAGAGEDPPA